jgi:predicted hydrocarbon binding protein
MNAEAGPPRFYANKLARVILLALEEVIGKNGIQATLNHAQLSWRLQHSPPDNLERQIPFSELSRIQKSLEDLYGLRGGRGLALRTGRACLKYTLRDFGSSLGLAELDFRLLPLASKMRQVSRSFAGLFSQISDQSINTAEDERYLFWQVSPCAVCWERRTDSPACHLLVGWLQEAMYWVSCGKHFCVEEIECTAQGDPACIIRIDKQPIE